MANQQQGSAGAKNATLAWGMPKRTATPAIEAKEIEIGATLLAATDTVAAPMADSLLDTVAAPSSATGALFGPPSSTATAARTTVLPRVRMIGDQPTLVTDPRVRYEPKKRLGEGGLGEVVSVEDGDIGRTAALKRLRADMKSPATVARFVEEIRTVGQLEHPNIVPIHDVGVDENGEYYFIMKYVDGETLESIIEKLAAGDREYHRRYGFEQRLEIFRGILDAIAFAHAQGIVHRDIKPANVMIGRFGEVVMMDWGIAKWVRGQATPGADLAAAPARAPAADERARLFETQVGSLIGTPAYMAPEQARGETCDERSEVYALSVLAHELMTLRHYLGDCSTLSELIEGIQKREPSFPCTTPSPHQGATPADISWFIMKGLEKDPAKRYPTVAAMIERLDLRAEGIIPIQCPFTFNRRMTAIWTRFYERHPVVSNAVVGVILLTLIVFAVRGIIS